MSSDAEQPELRPEGAGALLEWLVSDSCHALDGGDFIAALGRSLATSGMPIHHLAFHVRTLNPTLFGRSIVWRPGEPVVSLDLLHGEERSKQVQEGPLGYVTAEREWLVLRREDRRWAALAGLPLTDLNEICIAPMVHGPASPPPTRFHSGRAAGRVSKRSTWSSSAASFRRSGTRSSSRFGLV